MTLQELRAMLENTKSSSYGFNARCPAHPDAKNSLSVAERDGKILLKCFAGCSIDAVCSALSLRLEDLFAGTRKERGASTVGNARREVTAYKYRDQSGKVLYEHVRFEPKDFRHRRYDELGKIHWNLDGVIRVPYRLPELIQAKAAGVTDIYLAEGEKDVDKLAKLGLTSSNLKTWKPEFNEFVRDMNVIIVRDHDKPGVALASSTANAINHANSVRIVDLFDGEPLPDKQGKDLSDWIHIQQQIVDDESTIVSRFLKATAQNVSLQYLEAGNGVRPLEVKQMSKIEAEQVEWLWPPLLPLGTFCILEGQEGCGKTFTVCAVASAITRGAGLPGVANDQHVEPSNVLLISAEDSLSSVLKPRLATMGADTDRIFASDEPFSLDEAGIHRLDLAMEQAKPKLVVIDPLFSYTGRINLNNDNEIRSITDQLKRLAEKHSCTILGIRHIGKSKGMGDARSAGLNGIAWRASARSVLLMGQDPDNPSNRAICHTKCNVGPLSEKSVGFVIVDGKFFWTGESDLTAETMLSFTRTETTEERGEKHDAMAFLRETLGRGPMLAKDVQTMSRGLGISESTLRRAKAALSVKSQKDSSANGSWYWELPNHENKDAHIPPIEHLQIKNSTKPNKNGDFVEGAQPDMSEHVREHVREQDQRHVTTYRVAPTGTAGGREYGLCKCGMSAYIGTKCPACHANIEPAVDSNHA